MLLRCLRSTIFHKVFKRTQGASRFRISWYPGYDKWNRLYEVSLKKNSPLPTSRRTRTSSPSSQESSGENEVWVLVEHCGFPSFLFSGLTAEIVEDALAVMAAIRQLVQRDTLLSFYLVAVAGPCLSRPPSHSNDIAIIWYSEVTLSSAPICVALLRHYWCASAKN